MEHFPLKLDFKPLDERTTVLDDEGSTLATFYDENRTYVPLDQIANVMKESLISIEDARFYQHGPIDIQGTHARPAGQRGERAPPSRAGRR